MIIVPLAQAKNQLSELVSKLEAGETVSISRRGRLVAQLMKCSHDSTGAQSDQVQQALLKLRRLRQGVCLEGDLQEIAREGLVLRTTATGGAANGADGQRRGGNAGGRRRRSWQIL